MEKNKDCETFHGATDYQGKTYTKCDTCGAAHHFKSEYFARCWREQHSTGRHETLTGKI